MADAKAKRQIGNSLKTKWENLGAAAGAFRSGHGEDDDLFSQVPEGASEEERLQFLAVAYLGTAYRSFTKETMKAEERA